MYVFAYMRVYVHVIHVCVYIYTYVFQLFHICYEILYTYLRVRVYMYI